MGAKSFAQGFSFAAAAPGIALKVEAARGCCCWVLAHVLSAGGLTPIESGSNSARGAARAHRAQDTKWAVQGRVERCLQLLCITAVFPKTCALLGRRFPSLISAAKMRCPAGTRAQAS